jgi:hypothetical protein
VPNIYAVGDCTNRINLTPEALGELTGEVIAEQRVGGQRHVVAVLLRGAEGDHHRVAPSAKLRLDLGPGQLVELERADEVTLSARYSRPGDRAVTSP